MSNSTEYNPKEIHFHKYVNLKIIIRCSFIVTISLYSLDEDTTLIKDYSLHFDL